METIRLKHSALTVSRLCVGGCPMGGHGWGPVDKAQLTSAVHAALDSGVNFFDTADVYGLGRSERTLGETLAGRRHRAVIATKCGVRVENGRTFYDNSPGWIGKACEDSLRRLGTDYIDLYQLHYRDDTPADAVMEALCALRQQGKVRYLGLSNVSLRDMGEFMPWREDLVSFQNEYSLACRDREADILTLARTLDLTPMTWGSLGQGILTGKYGPATLFGSDDRRSREDYVNFHGEKLARNLRLLEAMKPIARERGVSLGAVAVRFILDTLPGSVALCGVKRPDQLLTDSLCWELSRQELAILDGASREEKRREHEQ